LDIFGACELLHNKIAFIFWNFEGMRRPNLTSILFFFEPDGSMTTYHLDEVNLCVNSDPLSGQDGSDMDVAQDGDFWPGILDRK